MPERADAFCRSFETRNFGARASVARLWARRCDTLFNPDHHGIRPDQMFYSSLPEPRFFHPPGAVGAGVVKPVLRFNEHVEAHQQPERILTPLVIDDSLINDHR